MLHFLPLFLSTDYERQKTAEIPKSLEEYILHLAKTGETLFPWPKIRGLIRRKLETVVADFRQVCPVEGLAPSPNVEPFHYETMKDKILEQFDSFTWYLHFQNNKFNLKCQLIRHFYFQCPFYYSEVVWTSLCSQKALQTYW